MFERTYGFSLEAQTKKSLKDAIKSLQEYEALGSDYVLATVIQQALGGHAIPVDEPARRVLERLGVAEAGTDNLALRAVLERAVPKNRGFEFIELIEELAHDTCVEGSPDCPHCELRKICPTGVARQEQAASAAEIVTAEGPQDRPRQEEGTSRPHQDRQGKGRPARNEG